MMEEETLQLIIRHLNELKTELKMDVSAVAAGQDELSAEMNAVYSGQEELKNDIENSIRAVKDEISAVKNELRQEISVFQERIRAGQAEFEERVTHNLREDLVRNVEAGQAEFEERVTCTVDTQLRNMSSMVEQQTRNLREDLSRNIETTRPDVEATRRNGRPGLRYQGDPIRNIALSLRLLVPSSPQVRRQSVQVYHHHSRPGVPLNSVDDIVDPGYDLVWAFPCRLQLW
jgi:FtsZ-binding cell division protein ZapB